jgi:hypothetical protein
MTRIIIESKVGILCGWTDITIVFFHKPAFPNGEPFMMLDAGW